MSAEGIPAPLPPGVVTNPTGTAIQAAARALAGSAFGGIYHDGDVYYVGFTNNADQYLSQLKSQFPTIELHTYATPRGADELEAISSAIETIMLTADPNGEILYAVPDETVGIVNVGAMDPGSPIAQTIASQYGRAVQIVKDEPLRAL